ncbi:hypothetical protein BH20ACT9_BH20ACT9_03490 [soil metagenome]
MLRFPTMRVAAASVAVALLAAGCAAGQRASRAGPQESGDPGVVHVHGLGVDPVDDTLYAATHTGLFAVAGDGGARRVGGGYHDLMGFTIVGHDDFVASGHPDLASDDLQRPGRPPLLGLVHSDDQGRSWEPISLLGDVDFHSLEHVHGRVYGWDATSGRFMVSDDRRHWRTRSRAPLLDFAVSPDDPELIVATSQDGLVRSTDGGRTWNPAAAEPALVIAWRRDGPVAATGRGRVLAGDASGEHWRTRGDLGGPPAALLAQGDDLYAAVHNQGLLRSGDGGATWRLILRTLS